MTNLVGHLAREGSGPDSVLDAFNGWAKALYLQEKYDEAIEKIQKATELDPTNPSFFNNWGKTLEKMGRDSEAQQKFAQSHQFSSNQSK